MPRSFQPTAFPAGTQVAWRTMFGDTLGGTVLDVGYDTLVVRRVDGGACTLHSTGPLAAQEVRVATPEDTLAACATFTHLGST